MSWNVHRRFLDEGSWTQNAPERYRTESTLASARTMLAISALIAIYIDPSEPDRFAKLAYGLLVAFVLYSLVVLVAIRVRKRVSDHEARLIHTGTIIWAAVISVFTSGPSSAFFVFFVFVILAAAFRWRMRETMTTTFALVVVLLFQIALFGYGPTQHFLGASLDLDHAIMRAAYLFILGFLAGYLGEISKQRTAELHLLTHLTALPRVERGLKGAAIEIARELRQIIGSRNELVFMREAAVMRAASFSLHSALTARVEGVWRDVSAREASELLFPLEHAVNRIVPNGNTYACLGVAEEGTGLVSGHDVILPPTLACEFTNGLIVCDFAGDPHWRIRLMLTDPAHGLDESEPLLFLHSVARQITPVLHNVFLTNRLREQATAAERAHVAREIHDGSVQSLAAAEMQLAALRGNLHDSPELAEHAERVRQIVHAEVRNLRDLMEQLRPLSLDSAALNEFIADLVERFQRDTGVEVNFVCDADLPLSPHACSEIAKIVREALANVRKHSHARNVLVSLRHEGEECRLVVDDDGTGFDFSGEYSLDELDLARRGPLVIKERVHAVGGDMTLRSERGEGAQLEIVVPVSADVSA